MKKCSAAEVIYWMERTGVAVFWLFAAILVVWMFGFIVVQKIHQHKTATVDSVLWFHYVDGTMEKVR